MSNYESSIELGKRYRHTRSGFVGYAVGITFYENACERVLLDSDGLNNEGKIIQIAVDSVELEDAETQAPVKEKTKAKPGGDRPEVSRR